MMKRIILMPILILFGLTMGCDSDMPTTAEEADRSIKTDDLVAEKRGFGASANTAPVYTFDGMKEAGSSTSLRTHSNVRMTIKTSGLDPHGTYTVWWVIFNNPDECENGCGEPDLFNDDVGGSVLYAAGHAIGGNGKGNFAGSLRTGDISGCQAPWDAFDLTLIDEEGELDMCREGLIDPQSAEIHLVVRTHGEKIPGMVNEQINTFAGGCTAESSFGASNGPNECVDQQFAIHFPEAN